MLSHGKSTSVENYEICKPDRMVGAQYRVLEILLVMYPLLLHLIFMYLEYVRLVVTGARLDH